MCSPRSIVASSAICRHLPGHRGDRPFQFGGDGAQSVTSAQPQADLFSFGECQSAWAGRPRIPPHGASFGLLKNEPDVLPRAADLLPDLPKRVTPRSQPQYKRPLLCGQAWSSHFATSPVDTSLLSSPRNCVDPLKPPSENHALIFNESITASHVVLVDVIRQQVDDQVQLFPESYRRSWRLTRIVSVYLVGQILRADPELKAILDDPKSALSDRSNLSQKLSLPIRVAAATLKQRHDQRDRDDVTDAFNVEFKRQDVLHELRDRARDNFSLLSTVGDLSEGSGSSEGSRHP